MDQVFLVQLYIGQLKKLLPKNDFSHLHLLTLPKNDFSHLSLKVVILVQ